LDCGQQVAGVNSGRPIIT